MVRFKQIVRIASTTRNFWCPMLVYLKIIRKCNVRLTDGTILEVSRRDWGEYWSRITTLYAKKKLHFRVKDKFLVEIEKNGKRLIFRLPEIDDGLEEFHRRILELYYFEPYRYLKVKNRVMIDIGAWIGDTPIYFARGEPRKS